MRPAGSFAFVGKGVRGNGPQADDEFDALGHGHIEPGHFIFRQQHEEATDVGLGVVGMKTQTSFSSIFARISLSASPVRNPIEYMPARGNSTITTVLKEFLPLHRGEGLVDLLRRAVNLVQQRHAQRGDVITDKSISFWPR